MSAQLTFNKEEYAMSEMTPQELQDEKAKQEILDRLFECSIQFNPRGSEGISGDYYDAVTQQWFCVAKVEGQPPIIIGGYPEAGLVRYSQGHKVRSDLVWNHYISLMQKNIAEASETDNGD